MLRRIAPLVATGVLLVMAAYSSVTLLTDPRFAALAGGDFAIYRDAAARWLHGGFFYYPEQVAGPYDTLLGHVMYPPPTLLLFLPFTVLPAVLWWTVPLGIVAWRVWSLRPSPWGWAGIAACLAWPMTMELVYTGNPLLGIVAALALATRWLDRRRGPVGAIAGLARSSDAAQAVGGTACPLGDPPAFLVDRRGDTRRCLLGVRQRVGRLVPVSREPADLRPGRDSLLPLAAPHPADPGDCSHSMPPEG